MRNSNQMMRFKLYLEEDTLERFRVIVDQGLVFLSHLATFGCLWSELGHMKHKFGLFRRKAQMYKIKKPD